MMDLRLSVTDLDAWRFFQHSTLSEEDAVRRILRQEPPSEAMKLGLSFEDFIMNPDEKTSIEGFTFYAPKDVATYKPQAIQIPIQKLYRVNGVNVTLSGRLDAVAGYVAIDWKTTLNAIDMDKYLMAYQWRCYLDMLGPHYTFFYEVFKLTKNRGQLHAYTLQDKETMRVGRYPGMQDDIRRGIAEYVDALLIFERQGKLRLTPQGPKSLRPPDVM